MIVDFSVITIYEVLALALSTIAILIPLIQYLWRKWVINPILIYLPTGRGFLYNNRSGSYIHIEGVFEAKNKPISVKNIELKVMRLKDEKVLNLKWSTFSSPVSQQIVGNYASMTETAHPFRIEADSIVCAFTEFADFYNSFYKTFQPYYDTLTEAANRVCSPDLPYGQAYPKYISNDSYLAAKSVLEKELFWEIGQYKVVLKAEYGKKSVDFPYEFSVNQDDYEKIKANLIETLSVPLKRIYGISLSMQTVQIELREK